MSQDRVDEHVPECIFSRNTCTFLTCSSVNIECFCRPEDILGDDTIVNIKKLRVLQRKGEEMERQKVVEKTRKYLSSVGDRINAVATSSAVKAKLWKVCGAV